MKLILATLAATAFVAPAQAQFENSRQCAPAATLATFDRELPEETAERLKLDKMFTSVADEAGLRQAYIAFDRYVTASNFKAERVAQSIAAKTMPDDVNIYKVYNASGNFYAGGTPDGTLPAPQKQLGALQIHYASFAGREIMTAQGWKICAGQGPLFNGKIHADYNDKSFTFDKAAGGHDLQGAAAMATAVVGAHIATAAQGQSAVDFPLHRAPEGIDTAFERLRPQIQARLNKSALNR